SLLALWFVNVSFAVTLPPGFIRSQVASGLMNPTAMEMAPDGRIFICEQTGNILIVKQDVLLAQPFVTISVDSIGERGVLGIAFDPSFSTNHYVYVYYTADSPTIHNRISRFTANGDVAVAGSEKIIFNITANAATSHQAGAIHFGVDEKLYIAVGDNQTSTNSQSLSNHFGKVLRINSDGTIPTDNPFYNVASGSNRAIWAMGLRNPFTFAVKKGTGAIYINDVGED